MSESADQHDQLDEHVDPPWEPPISGPEAELSAEEKERLRALGYLR